MVTPPDSDRAAEPGARVTISVRPERLRIVDAGFSPDAGQNRVSGRVHSATYLGTLYRLHVAVGDAMLIAHVPVAARLQEGASVELAFPASETLVLVDSDPAPGEAEP